MFKIFLMLAIGATMICETVAQTPRKAAPSRAMLGFVDGLPWMRLTHTVSEKPGKLALDANTAIAADMALDLRKTLGLALESFMPFQFKYAVLLNESVEKISNVVLYKTIDQWYGTRYRYGGTSTRGIDCSAFMQVLSGYAFGWMLPRTAREQYRSMSAIRKEDLREGDFVFFNTRGGISHVGMYLQNNKFVHSSSSHGVSIGDLTDKYWSARFIGAKRVAGSTPNFTGILP
jgi:lipoprotein Spr